MNAGGGKKRKTLSGRILRALVIFALVICVFSGAVVSVMIYRRQVQEGETMAFSYAKSAADYIDGDRIAAYVATGQTDAYYDQVQQFLDAVKRESNMWYYYVFVHNGDHLTYIWDAATEETKNYLGDTEDYYGEAQAAVEAILTPDPPEIFYVNWVPDFGLTGTARVPIYDSSGAPAAVVGVDLNMPDVQRMVALFLLLVVGSVVLVTALGGLLFYWMVNRSILRPVSALDDATRELVANMDREEPFRVDIHTGDELETLAESFAKMDLGLREYIRELNQVTAEKERIGAELNVATQIQADMLPRIFPPFPDRTDIDIYATMDPAKEVGGDFYDFFLVDDDHLALVMADVSGKGVPAALFMVIAKTLIKNRMMAGDSPAVALSHVNEQLCEGNEAELFVTVWLAKIDLRTGKGMAANAGHEHPALRRADGKYELVVYRHSPAVATMEGMRFREHEFQLNPGDSLFVYTDGVAEATDAHNELYGSDRMLEALNADPMAKPDQLLPAVKRSIDAFVGEAPQFDDITMLNLQYYGPRTKTEAAQA
ncbi:MAG: SpoIIE family protein phosphatase [Oscillospiraceae bacterium]|nr:SpoIIE family protein phosphatase [Oscillospiraceae bacterium]